MIGCIEVKCSAHSPQKPLEPMFAFIGSPSSIRVKDVPRSIGNWNITNVYLQITYPDGSQKSKEALRNGNVWVGTFEGCDISGKVSNGYKIVADGIDENKNDVQGYVLGAGDVYVLQADSTIRPDDERYFVKYSPTVPETPNKGDLVIVDDEYAGKTTIQIFDGTVWKSQTVPTKTSDLTNDSGYISQHDGVVNIGNTLNVGEQAQGIVNIGHYEGDIYLGDSDSQQNVHLHGGVYEDGYIEIGGERVATVGQIPTVNNPTITLTQGGVSKGTFTLNQSTDKTIDLDAGGGEKITVSWCVYNKQAGGSQSATIGDAVVTFSEVGSMLINGQQFIDEWKMGCASGVVVSENPIPFKLVGYGYAADYCRWYKLQNGTITRITSDVNTTLTTDTQLFLVFDYCLDSHTPILMSDGTTKQIKDVRLGDKVMSLNPDTMKLEEDEVVDCDGGSKKMSFEKDVWTFSDGTTISTIHPHQFYNVRLGRMEYIANFQIGDEVLKSDGTKTSLVSHAVEDGIFFHNTLFTRKFNNYFANGVLSGNRHSKKFGWYWIEQQHK